MENMKIYNALVAAKLASTSGGGGGNIASNNVTAMTGYSKAQTVADISTSDSLNVAMGKLEKRVSDNATDILSKAVYCTCSTASSTAAKVVDAPNGFVLQTGCIIGVLFSNNNLATNVTLNVGGTGAISIAYGVSRPYTGTFTKIAGYKEVVSYYMYDGSYWVFITNGIAYSNMAQSEASAGSSTTDRLITAKVLNDTIAEKTKITATASSVTIGDTSVTDVIFCGNKKISFNEDGTVTWEEAT